MSSSAGGEAPRPLRLRLPATSANLGPGFDTVALALDLYLEIEARPAPVDAGGLARYSIEASGRDTALCSRVEGNLLLTTYEETVRRHTGREAPHLALKMENGIPLGMGCGSSAASRLAAVALASHFGGLSWSKERVLEEAVRLEGHPDNAAACWLGGFVVSAWNVSEGVDSRPGGLPVSGAPPHGQAGRVAALSIAPPRSWQALLVLPEEPLATSASRAVLPEHYPRHTVVSNLQRVALLTAAFAAGRGDLLATATGDGLHQPYRAAVCPLLALLMPLSGQGGVLSVTLSGAGPSVLLLVESSSTLERARLLVEERLASSAARAMVLVCGLATGGATLQVF
ncbi:MAG TPA: homoserine kinase [Acidobacteriaceae bacterium]